MGAPTTDGFISKGHRTDALHTLSLLAPHVRPGDSVLDVGCGYGYVLDQLGRRERVECMGIDIVDQRAVADHPFALWDGRTIPFEDGRFDVVMLNFVLHHVANELKEDVISAAARVCRRTQTVTNRPWFPGLLAVQASGLEQTDRDERPGPLRRQGRIFLFDDRSHIRFLACLWPGKAF